MVVAIGTARYSLFPTFFPQWFIAQGLKPDVYYEAAAVMYLDPAGTTLRESSQGKPRKRFANDGFAGKDGA